MAGWLTKATAHFRRAEPTPDPYEVACECGTQINGFRVPMSHTMNCTGCGRRVWILPANVYPPVKPRTAPVAASRPKTVVQDDGPEIDSGKAGKKKAKSASREAPVSKRGKTREQPAEPVVPAVVLSPAQQAALTRRRKLRLVLAAMTVLVALTGWSVWQRARREQARTAIPLTAESGLAALRDGRFADAERDLTIAAQGVDVLDRRDVAAETIRRAFREATAANQLAHASLSEMAESYLTDFGSDEERQRNFQNTHGSEWLIWDVYVVRSVNDERTMFVDVPFLTGNRPLHVECDFPELEAAVSQTASQTPRRAVFAAQVEGWKVPVRETLPIVARLKAANAFLWTDYDSLVAVGYRPENSEAEQRTRELLARQREQVLP